jgi:site-specific DNA recombinase
MKRAVTYGRVSHKDVERGISIDIQQEQNLRAIAAEGFRHTASYVDDGISAYNDQISARPDFSRMLEDARAKRFDVLVVYKWDRLARKQVIFYSVLAELERLGIVVHAATESNDWLARGVSGLMAEQYSRMLSSRMKDVRRWEASQGRHIGGVPWGFKREGNSLVPTDLIRWPVRAFTLYASRRYGFGALSDQLTTEGARLESGKIPTKFQIAEVLRNPAYIGMVRCNDETFKGNHAPVIDQHTWSTVQSILQERAKGGRRHKVVTVPLLSGLARCAECGMPMWYSGNGRGYYQCSGRLTRATQCAMGGVQAPAAEKYLIDSLIVLTDDAELMQAIVDELDGLIEGDAPPPVDADAINAKIRRVARLYEDGLKSELDYQREITALRAQLDTPPQNIDMPDAALALEMLGGLPGILQTADTTDRRTILQSLLTSVELEPHRATKAKARDEYHELLLTLDARVEGTDWWAGWGSNPRHSA